MDVNEEYFIPMRHGVPDAPLLNWGDDNNEFVVGQPVTLLEPIQLILADPEPNHPVMADYLRLPEAVFSKKVKNVLELLNVKGVQLLPAKIKVDNDKIYDYWLFYIYKLISGLIDFDISEFRISETTGNVLYVKKFILKDKVVREIPMGDRLVFRLEEFSSRELYHKTVVDKIMAVEPTGIKFWPLTEWNPFGS